MEDKYSVSGLYYRYKRKSDDKIRELLGKIKIVKLENKGANSIHGYYPISSEGLTKIIEKPRNISLTFDADSTENEALTNLKEWKRITYLVKSTSRFFLKPDVGEIFDQINFHDLSGNKIKAICYLNGHDTLPDTDGEHHLMSAALLVDINEDIDKL
jgi:hypothetical protein